MGQHRRSVFSAKKWLDAARAAQDDAESRVIVAEQEISRQKQELLRVQSVILVQVETLKGMIKLSSSLQNVVDALTENYNKARNEYLERHGEADVDDDLEDELSMEHAS